MNVVLTDHLVCPRCGPPFGLVLLAHEVRDRRIKRGDFGCANCRDRFPVEDGFGDLRPPPRGAPPGGTSQGDEVSGGEPDEIGTGGRGGAGGGGGRAGAPAGVAGGHAATRALRLAAALGVTEGPGIVVVPDSHRDEAVMVPQLVRGIEVVVVGWAGRGLATDGVSAFVTGPRLPLRDGVARGVVTEGGSGQRWWAECLRVLMPGRRIVIAAATDVAHEWARSAGLAKVMDESGVLVVALPVPGAGPRKAHWMGAAHRQRG